MTIHRDPHHSDFTCVSNKLIKDKRISLAAKGFMLMVLSLSDDWKFSMRGMAKFVGVTVGTLYRYVDELYSYGYVEKFTNAGIKGRFSETDVVFNEVSRSENECIENETRSENECVENETCSQKPYTENATQNNINKNNNIIIFSSSSMTLIYSEEREEDG